MSHAANLHTTNGPSPGQVYRHYVTEPHHRQFKRCGLTQKCVPARPNRRDRQQPDLTLNGRKTVGGLANGAGARAGAGSQVFMRGQRVRIPSETVLTFTLEAPVKIL
jgi:hypothetical protein